MITSLAASTVTWTVTHPSIDQAHGCLTSVIRPWMVAPCQRGSLWRRRSQICYGNRAIPGELTSFYQLYDQVPCEGPLQFLSCT